MYLLYKNKCYAKLCHICHLSRKRAVGCLVVWSFGRLVVWSFGRLESNRITV